MRRFLTIALTLVVVLAIGWLATPVWAQEGGNNPGQALFLYTKYPSQVTEPGKTVSFPLTLKTDTKAQIVKLSMKELPDGWEATFRGSGRVIKAAYVTPDNDVTVDLKLEPKGDVAAGDYHFVVLAEGDGVSVSLPLDITVEEKLPPRLTFTTDLPTLKGTPTSTFRFNTTLKNEGDETLDVNLIADAPPGFNVNFRLSGKDITSLPIEANETKRITVEAKAFGLIPAGTYPLKVIAQGGDVQAELDLTIEVAGQPDLKVSGPDGRLSGEAYAGKESPIKVIITNNGTAEAHNVELSASTPSGWKVTFEPKVIENIPVGEQAEVTANIVPGEKAIAGDYIVTIRAKPAEGSNASADFRITVRTSTLWGVVGIVVIAIALGVVALAVARYGRR
ncbi:MAG TPA: hypothetical protein ENK60_07105 [Anaerolineae bacterium]|nr:hypothetical protein [Anaerolineae bacterium]